MSSSIGGTIALSDWLIRGTLMSHPLPSPSSIVRLTAEGRGAATIYRDRGTGKITTKEEFAEARKDARTKEREAKAKEREERVGAVLTMGLRSD